MVDDDVIDYMIMEAVAVKASNEDREAEESETKKDWKSDREGLKNLRQMAA